MQTELTAVHTDATSTKGKPGYVYLISIVAAVGGLLFGFDIAVIAGAIPFLKRHFALTASQLGLAVSAVAFGCMLGASAAGFISDRIGRKKVLILAAVLFVLSSVWTAIPRALVEFILARFLSGVAIGLASPVSPVYIAEVAPARIRGRLVTLNQLAITFGMLVAYAIGWLLASRGSPEWRDSHAWRWMFASGVFPAALFLLALFLVPESPRWLAKRGWYDRARKILASVGGDEHARQEMVEIQDAISHEEASLAQLFRHPFVMPTIIGALIMVFSQACGLQAVTQYCPKLLLELGFQSESSAMLGMLMVGVVLFGSTILTMFIVDKLGRRVLLLLSSAGVIVCLLLFAVEFQFHVFSNQVVLIIVLLSVVSYAIGIGPCAWLIVSEIFPTRVRGRATSLCTFCNWITDFVILLIFPKLQEWSQVGTFLVFASITLVIMLVLAKMVPETKGMTLEQIEAHWRHWLPAMESEMHNASVTGAK
jgi:MFS transporter, SP family, arabinose:H+ symporter